MTTLRLCGDHHFVTRSNRLLKNESRSVSRSSLWFSVRSLCLCGECFCSHFHHRDTENHRDRTEKSLTQLEPITFSAPHRGENVYRSAGPHQYNKGHLGATYRFAISLLQDLRYRAKLSAAHSCLL